jgi:hypothetical protein|tara:strand:+ start:596 stop:700 length:105 start_codon:yes stop_codon:yes gene_type:complete
MFRLEVLGAKNIALFSFKLRIVPLNQSNGARMAV